MPVVNPVMVFRKHSERSYKVLDHLGELRGFVEKQMRRTSNHHFVHAEWTAWRRAGVAAHAGSFRKRKDAAAYLFT